MTVFHEAALKAAEKALKKADEGSLKLKKLSKRIVKRISSNHPTVDKDKVVKWIQTNSSLFSVKGKSVSLVGSQKKRTSEDQGDEKSNKRAKSSPEEAVCTSGNENIADWRLQHKIVIKDTRDDEEGQKRSKLLNEMNEYYPYSTFEEAQKHVPQALIDQCTKANGFKKPSPIQAQCWPVLLESFKGRKRDVVGIAETGSG
jgi:hypothetical protein